MISVGGYVKSKTEDYSNNSVALCFLLELKTVRPLPQSLFSNTFFIGRPIQVLHD